MFLARSHFPQTYGKLPLGPPKPDQKDIEKSFARCFSTEDGRCVLEHLQAMTFQRVFGPEAADEQLRYAEGQRAMIATILRLIDRGRGG